MVMSCRLRKKRATCGFAVRSRAIRPRWTHWVPSAAPTFAPLRLRGFGLAPGQRIAQTEAMGTKRPATGPGSMAAPSESLKRAKVCSLLTSNHFGSIFPLALAALCFQVLKFELTLS